MVNKYPLPPWAPRFVKWLVTAVKGTLTECPDDDWLVIIFVPPPNHSHSSNQSSLLHHRDQSGIFHPCFIDPLDQLKFLPLYLCLRTFNRKETLIRETEFALSLNKIEFRKIFVIWQGFTKFRENHWLMVSFEKFWWLQRYNFKYNMILTINSIKYSLSFSTDHAFPSSFVTRVVCPNFGHSDLTSSFTKYKCLLVKNSFATIVNGLLVLKLFQLSNGNLYFS